MKSRINLLLMVAALVGAGVFFLLPSRGAQEMASAELSVGNLTCTACVRNVQTALAGVPGVGPVEVNLADGQTRVAFDPERTNAETLAARLSAAGYPATVQSTLTAAEVQQRQQEEERLAARFVARIGERLLSQEEFARELDRHADAHGLVSLATRGAVWQELLQRNLLLEAATRAGIAVEDEAIDRELERLRHLVGFAGQVRQLGGEESFRQRLQEDMAIGRLIETQALVSENGAHPQATLNAWYRGLVETTPVTIFDAQLKAAVQGGCGSCAKPS
jgi:copper chaperone CopZ